MLFCSLSKIPTKKVTSRSTTARLFRRLLSSSETKSRLHCVMLNAARLDFDRRIDFGKLDKAADVTRFEISLNDDEIVERVAGHDVVVNKEMPLGGDVIRRFDSSVKLICEAGTGYNNIDLEAAHAKGIEVCNVPTYATEAMAHIAVTMVMALSCSLVPQAKALALGNKTFLTQCHLGTLPHFELTDKTIGLIGGLGTIGRRVSTMCRALGLKVVVSSTSQPHGMRDDGVEVVPFDRLMESSDFVSIHCPLHDDTRHMVDAAALGKMKPTAYLINTARGAIVHQEALLQVLQEKKIAGAALDVFGEGSAPPPPLPQDSPLYKLDNVILTPHIGWQRIESRQRVVDTCAENIASFARGEPTNIDMETGRPRRRRTS